MKQSTKDAIIGAIAGATITGVISLLIFHMGNFTTKEALEKGTVNTLSEYFDSVNKDMSYKKALQTIYEENETLKDTLVEKENQLDEQKLIEEIDKVIQKASEYRKNSDYVQALEILNSVTNKTPEINIIIKDYTKEYESYVIDETNNLKSKNKLDEASSLLEKALKVIPESQLLKDKQEEIKKSYPQNMIDVVPAYQSGGNPYTEYSSSESGATEHFSMGGVKYTDGMTFNADINIFDDVSWAVYNLGEGYSSLEFIVGHVDGTFNGDETFLEVFYDGQLKEEIPLSPEMLPVMISLDITGVNQLKMQVHSSGGEGPVYGLGNPKIR